MTAKPLPCPFCGGEPTIIRRTGAYGVRCTCEGKRFLHTYGKTETEAVESWNERRPVDNQPVDNYGESGD